MGKVVFSKELFQMSKLTCGVWTWVEPSDGYPVVNGTIQGTEYASTEPWEIELAEDYGPEYVWPDGYMRIFSVRKFKASKDGSVGWGWLDECDGHAVIDDCIAGTAYSCSNPDASGSYNVDNWCLKIPRRVVEEQKEDNSDGKVVTNLEKFDELVAILRDSLTCQERVCPDCKCHSENAGCRTIRSITIEELCAFLSVFDSQGEVEFGYADYQPPKS